MGAEDMEIKEVNLKVSLDSDLGKVFERDLGENRILVYQVVKAIAGKSGGLMEFAGHLKDDEAFSEGALEYQLKIRDRQE